MINRYFYKETLATFLTQDTDTIFGIISRNDEGDTVKDQKKAWDEEIESLKEELSDYKNEKAEIVFEYSIPRLGKRIDVVLLLRDIVFVLEFKAGKDEYTQQDIDQVMDYALDLKNFHLPSHDRIIVPILVATEASKVSKQVKLSVYNDQIYNPLLINSASINKTIGMVLQHAQPPSSYKYELSAWANGRYAPTPTIIEAASALYSNHSVEDITKSEAEGASLEKTTKYVLDVIKQSKERGEKSICFVTGVPGAGKTLVGLNVAIQQSMLDESGKRNLAVYLSGNGPLVKVLTAALAKDKQEREKKKGKKYNLSDAKREVSQFIQIIHRYRDNMLAKIKLPITNGKLEIDKTKSEEYGDSGHAEVEHVAIFDEAQRSWDLKHLSSWLAQGGSRGGKKKIADFPMSEAEFLIWSLDQRKDWAVIICLVGGGQEINAGEAGIKEWIRAMNETFPDWKVYISSQLKEKEYAEGNVTELLQHNPNAILEDNLHLAVSMRSFRAETLSAFVHALLDREKEKASTLYKGFCDKFKLVLTRDLDKAKEWLISQARGSERYGIVVSSQAYRLRPLSIDVRFQPDTEHWFLTDKTDVRSSLFLEDVATEFDIQGLELDWTSLAWDGDFQYSDKGWKHFSFKGSKWQNINKPELQSYQLNAYRVLLTRARQGMVICVPEGNPDDPTRLPEFYNSTYEYLKGIGIRELE